MDDRIELRGLRVVGICGALPEERERAQPLEVDLDVVADLSLAGASDDLADTVDYGRLSRLVEAVIADGHFVLLERLATCLADAVLDADVRVSAVVVAVRKLRPPVAQQLETSGVRLERVRT